MNYKNRKAHSERMKGNKLFQGKTHSEKTKKKYIPTEEHKRKQSEGVQKYWNKVKKGEINDPRYPHN